MATGGDAVLPHTNHFFPRMQRDTITQPFAPKVEISMCGMAVTANPLKEWAVFVYMCANVPQSGMRKASRANLLQMANTGSSDDVWVAAQLACPGPRTYRYIFPERPPGSTSATISPVQTITSVDSGLASSIQDFFAWASTACPAKNTMLVLWGHGFGIDYYNPLASFTPLLLRQLSPLVTKASEIDRTLDTAIGATGNYGTFMSFGWDASSNNVLDNNQIGDALRACAKSLPPPRKLAIMGFDACVMAMAEVWCEMNGAADIGIASQAGLPYLSWPYDEFLQRLLQQPAAQPVEVAEMLTQAFLQFYGKHPTEYVTLSVCDLKLIRKFEEALAPLARALAASTDPQARQNIFEAQRYCPHYDKQGFIDLGCFCKYLSITMPNSPVSAACESALQGLGDFVISAGYSPQKPDRTIALSSGVSVWFPPWTYDPGAFAIEKDLAEAYLTDGYPKTKFALTTEWNKFLTNFRDRAWAEPSEGGSRTVLQPERAASKCRIHNGGNTMSDGKMGDARMGDERMGDERMGAEAQNVFTTASSGAAGIVLRATVESFGPAGDTELHLTVKWPASTLGAVQMGAISPRQESQAVAPSERGNPENTDGELSAAAKAPASHVESGKPHLARETLPTELE